MPPPPLLPSWSSTTTVNYILSLCWLYLRQKAIYCNLLSISLSIYSRSSFGVISCLWFFLYWNHIILIFFNFYLSNFQTFLFKFSFTIHSTVFYEWMFFLCNTFSKKKINKVGFLSPYVWMNNWTSRFLVVFLYSIFGIIGTQILIPRKAINCTYFTTIIGREKNWKNHIEFSSVSSNIVSHQKPPSISEDFFFLFKNLRIACWSCVQKSNHRTRKSDFYWWFIGNNLPADLFWGCLLSIKSKLIDQYRPSQSIENFEILFWNVSYCAKSSRVLLYRIQIFEEIFVEIHLLVRRIKGWLFLP